uniref:Uncharacterized protein n=1 Tax=Arundo donax TaxID=35708 RepID=A0A0A8ZFD1_ARUDO
MRPLQRQRGADGIAPRNDRVPQVRRCPCM